MSLRIGQREAFAAGRSIQGRPQGPASCDGVFSRQLGQALGEHKPGDEVAASALVGFSWLGRWHRIETANPVERAERPVVWSAGTVAAMDSRRPDDEVILRIEVDGEAVSIEGWARNPLALDTLRRGEQELAASLARGGLVLRSLTLTLGEPMRDEPEQREEAALEKGMRISRDGRSYWEVLA